MKEKIRRARIEGGIHWSCTHEPPLEYSPEELAAYEAAAIETAQLWAAHTDGKARY